MALREPMKARNIRIPNHLWSAAQAKADEHGDNLSEEIRRFLERYVKAK